MPVGHTCRPGSDQARTRLAGRPRREVFANVRVAVGLEVLDEILSRRGIFELTPRTIAAPIGVDGPVLAALRGANTRRSALRVVGWKQRVLRWVSAN